jgi:hypothetical protein
MISGFGVTFKPCQTEVEKPDYYQCHKFTASGCSECTQLAIPSSLDAVISQVSFDLAGAEQEIVRTALQVIACHFLCQMHHSFECGWPRTPVLVYRHEQLGNSLQPMVELVRC